MCGLFGIIGKRSIAEAIYHGITQLQHRGQDAAGIFVYDPLTASQAIYKDLGLVNQVFTSKTLPLPHASWGIGHVRYATIGKVRREDTQPFVIQGKHTIAMAHNGNVVNYLALREELEASGERFESFCDVEVILKLFYSMLPDGQIHDKDIVNAVNFIYKKVIGAYSVVALIPGVGMVAFRDPKGIRPLLFGVNKNADLVACASETHPLDYLGCHTLADVAAGEMVFVNKNLGLKKQKLSTCQPAHCSFEYDYFSKPNSIINEREVYSIRKALGKLLAEKVRAAKVRVDVVVPVPSTARPAAISLAQNLNVLYEEGFVKQDYIGRTFIMPTKVCRKSALLQKLAPVASVFKGRSTLLVDDSIVRGTVSKRVVSLAKRAGAKRVYFASTFPPIRFPCVYGVDFPSKKELIASGKPIEKVCAELEADLLFYNDKEALVSAFGSGRLCNACLTGEYPTATDGKEQLQKRRLQDLAELEMTWKR